MGTHLLQVNFIPVFLPVIRAVDARRTIWGVEANALSGFETPSSDAEYTTGLVRENNIGLGGESTTVRLESRKGTHSTENVRLDMHRSPGAVEVVLCR
jgi:hypothetical protein